MGVNLKGRREGDFSSEADTIFTCFVNKRSLLNASIFKFCSTNLLVPYLK